MEERLEVYWAGEMEVAELESVCSMRGTWGSVAAAIKGDKEYRQEFFMRNIKKVCAP